MKKLFSVLMVVSLLFFVLPEKIIAEEKANEAETSRAMSEITLEIKTKVNRLGEIKAMDLSELTASEKKELRKEVRSIHKELKAYSKADSEARGDSEAAAEAAQTGIYISGSAIIIILLLILLL